MIFTYPGCHFSEVGQKQKKLFKRDQNGGNGNNCVQVLNEPGKFHHRIQISIFIFFYAVKVKIGCQLPTSSGRLNCYPGTKLVYYHKTFMRK